MVTSKQIKNVGEFSKLLWVSSTSVIPVNLPTFQ